MRSQKRGTVLLKNGLQAGATKAKREPMTRTVERKSTAPSRLLARQGKQAATDTEMIEATTVEKGALAVVRMIAWRRSQAAGAKCDQPPTYPPLTSFSGAIARIPGIGLTIGGPDRLAQTSLTAGETIESTLSRGRAGRNPTRMKIGGSVGGPLNVEVTMKAKEARRIHLLTLRKSGRPPMARRWINTSRRPTIRL